MSETLNVEAIHHNGEPEIIIGLNGNQFKISVDDLNPNTILLTNVNTGEIMQFSERTIPKEVEVNSDNEYIEILELSDLEELVKESGEETEKTQISYEILGEEVEVPTMNEFNQLKENVNKKLNIPTGSIAVGKILKIKSVNSDGSYNCEWTDYPKAIIENGILKVT